MSVARRWFEQLDPEMRALVLRVLALTREPTDAQIEEAPDLIAKSWALDSIGIPADQQPAVRAAIGDLATELRRRPKR